MKKNISFLIASILSTSLLIGCSDSGGGVAKANISAENYKDLTIASAEAAKKAVADNSNNQFSALFKAGNGNNSSVNSAIKQASKLTETVDCDISGSFTFQNINELATTEEAILAGASIVFNSCNDGEGIVEGTISNISFTETSTGEISNFTATNLSVAFEGISNFSGEITCTWTFATDNEVCTTSGGSNDGGNSSFTGSLDDREYSVSAMTVEENTNGSYNINGNVVDPMYGSITIAIENITFNCSGGQPGTGSVTLTGAEGTTAIITFDSCTHFTVSLGDGSASDTFTWAEIL